MSIDLKQDFFALFGLPRQFGVDGGALEIAYHDLQSKVHPDRFAALDDADQRRSMQWATHVNEGYRTLRAPLARARYLLELSGVDVGLSSNTAMAPEFLMEQMEWREAVEEARGAGECDALEHLHRRLRDRAREVFAELGEAIDVRGDLHAAADILRRLMFMDKLQHEIDDALEALET